MGIEKAAKRTRNAIATTEKACPGSTPSLFLARTGLRSRDGGDVHGETKNGTYPIDLNPWMLFPS